MNWINPPDRVKRFTLQQILQHAAAMIAGLFLAGSVAAFTLLGAEWGRTLHVGAGLAGAGLYVLHLFSLVAIGVRYDVSPDNAAFLPMGARKGTDGEPREGKYSGAEKWDYFLLLLLVLPALVTGVLVRWPGTLGIPGPATFDWLRTVHAGFGAAFVVHLLAVHVPGRLLRSRPECRWAIFKGKVPRAFAESRPGWVDELVERGVLVPTPEEKVEQESHETGKVRALLDVGNRLAKEGRYDEACGAYEEALLLYPEYSQALFNLAVARLRQGSKERAAGHFETFLRQDPFNPMADRARELLAGIARGNGGAR